MNTPIYYTYDYNGNVITDAIKNIYDIEYDYRNLITEFKQDTTIQEVSYTYWTRYRYDESGNRMMKYVQRKDHQFMNWELVDREYYFEKSELDNWILKHRIKTEEEIELEADEYIRNHPRKF